jgi:hypothetical protein
MDVTPNHTATPWRAECWTCHAPVTVLVDDASDLTGKRVVAECEREEDAAFIVKACGAHHKLVNALDEISAVAACSVELSDWPELQQALEHARAALAAAGEPV